VSPLERLRAVLVEEDELLAAVLRPNAAASDEPGLGRIAAGGPRAAAAPDEYCFLVETIYEGYLLHYGATRLFDNSDEDFALLAGDRLYALGLERLVALGDLDAVSELAEVIALCALLSARGEGQACADLWVAGVKAVGFGASPQYAHIKVLLRSGDPAGLAALSDHAGLA
jgi:hypothetical protein